MQRLSSRIWPLGWHPGGLGWWLGRFEKTPADVTLARKGDDVVGWAAFSHDEELTIDADPAHSEAMRELVAWVSAPVLAPAANRELIAALETAGFEADVAAPWIGLWLDASPLEPAAPVGYRVRATRPEELRQRVDVHRAAWRPADLPYHRDHRRDVSPEATSNFTDDVYERVRAIWLYDPELDLVAEAHDGSLAACCVGWFDPSTGVTEIEPLGVHPAHRNRGLAGALCHEMALRTARRGGREVFINNAPSAAYPAPAGAYIKAGFRPIERGWTFRRRET